MECISAMLREEGGHTLDRTISKEISVRVAENAGNISLSRGEGGRGYRSGRIKSVAFSLPPNNKIASKHNKFLTMMTPRIL